MGHYLDQLAIQIKTFTTNVESDITGSGATGRDEADLERLFTEQTRVRRAQEAGGTVYGDDFSQVFHRDPFEVQERESRIQELGTDTRTLASKTATIGTDLQKLSADGQEDTEEFKLLQQQYKDYREALQRLEEESRQELSLMQMMVKAKEAYIENLEVQADEATMAGDVDTAMNLREQAQQQRVKLEGAQHATLEQQHARGAEYTGRDLTGDYYLTSCIKRSTSAPDALHGNFVYNICRSNSPKLQRVILKVNKTMHGRHMLYNMKG
jgi:hypothetical protein